MNPAAKAAIAATTRKTGVDNPPRTAESLESIPKPLLKVEATFPIPEIAVPTAETAFPATIKEGPTAAAAAAIFPNGTPASCSS